MEILDPDLLRQAVARQDCSELGVGASWPGSEARRHADAPALLPLLVLIERLLYVAYGGLDPANEPLDGPLDGHCCWLHGALH